VRLSEGNLRFPWEPSLGARVRLSEGNLRFPWEPSLGARVRLSADRGLGGRRPWAPGFVPVERRELPANAPPGRIHSIFPLFPRRRQNIKVVLLCVIPEYSREHSRWEHHSISPVKPRHRQDPTEGFLWDTPPMLPGAFAPPNKNRVWVSGVIFYVFLCFPCSSKGGEGFIKARQGILLLNGK
jgi:hypothetical protein